MGFTDEFAEFFEFLFGFTGKTDNEGGAQCYAGNRAAHLLDGTQEQFGAPASFHSFQGGRRGVLQRDVDVGTDVFVGGDGFEETTCDFIGVRVEKTDPAKIFNCGQLLQQNGESFLQAEIFAVTSRVLADKRNLADAAASQALSLCDDRLKSPGTEFAAQLGNDAEAARVIAALGNLDVGGVARRREDARGAVVVEIVGKIGNRAIPGITGEAALLGADITFGSRTQNYEGRIRRGGASLNSRGGKDFLQFARADHRVHFRNVLADFVAKTLDQASSNHQFLRAASGFMTSHFQNRVHRLLLRTGNEGAGVDYDDVSVLGVLGQFCPCLREHAHHDLAIHEVLGTAQADKADFRTRGRWGRLSIFAVLDRFGLFLDRHAILLF